MMSLKTLHEIADEALKLYLDAEAGRSAVPLEIHELKQDFWQARDALKAKAAALRFAAALYDQSPTAEHYSRLIAAALACHATDQEATDA